MTIFAQRIIHEIIHEILFHISILHISMCIEEESIFHKHS